MNAQLLQGGLLAAAVAPILLTVWMVLGWCQRKRVGEGWSIAAVFVAIGAIYVLSSLMTHQGPLGESGFPHYARLAEALLHGRLDLAEPLFEVAVHGGRIYVMEPIGPAIFMLPFVAVWGRAFSDVAFLILVGALNAALLFSLWPKVMAWEPDRPWPADARYWLTVLGALGTPHWYLAISGRVWHTEGLMALSCLLVAVHEALGRGRLALMHAWLGFSFLCHPPAILSLPFFWLLCGARLRRAGMSTRRVLLALGGGLLLLGAIVLVGWGWYNFLRFGSLFETGLTPLYRENVADGISAPYGLMSVRHLPSNIRLALLRMPLPLRGRFPFLALDYGGFSLFWATPAFLYIFWALRRRLLPLASWSGLALVLGCLLMYHNTGFSQFGYRRIMDALPFVLLLTALGMQRCRWRLARPLIVLSVMINLIGLVWFYTSS